MQPFFYGLVAFKDCFAINEMFLVAFVFGLKNSSYAFV
tara:strand:- start:681 stop:794 length:114 start_codon:yes stop_codon:yes gene_type:complete